MQEVTYRRSAVSICGFGSPLCVSVCACVRYTQLDWVSEIRRWPPSLVSELRSFINDVGGVEDIARKGNKII